MKSVYEEWREAKRVLADAKTRERELRDQICNSLFGTRVGSFTVKKAQGTGIYVAKSKITHSVDKNILIDIHDELTEAEKACVRYKPELNLTPYKKLPEDSILHDAVTVKPAAPELKFEEV